MIYIKNNTEIQTIFIPRSELQKEAYIASTKTYEDGYKDGFGEGKQYQKDQLLNLYVTENGEYEREDGWGVVTVDVHTEGGDCSEAYDKGFEDGYNQGQAECPEGGDLNIDAVSTSLGAGNWNRWTRAASDFGLDGMSEITIDGLQYKEWTKAYTLLQAYQNTEETHITENGEYRANIGYDGIALRGYNVGWVIEVIPTIDTDVEIWVKPYDGAPNYWQGFIGSQMNDDDNTTFQIRKVDGSNTFSFRFGDQTFEYGYENERWYRLRMNRNGVWVNGEQVCGWDVQTFEENSNPLMINGIYNLGFEGENYRMNYASYGYVYFHNTDSLLVPFQDGFFIGNGVQTIARLVAEGATLQYEIGYYPKGYTKVTVDVPKNGDCSELTTLDVTENGSYEGAFSLVNVNVPQEGGSCNIQGSKTIELDGERMGIYPDEGYDGIFEVIVDASRKAEEWREEGRSDIRNKLQTIEITENGRYSVEDTIYVDSLRYNGGYHTDTISTYDINRIEVTFKADTSESINGQEKPFILGGSLWGVNENYGEDIACARAIQYGYGRIVGYWEGKMTDAVPTMDGEWLTITLDENGMTVKYPSSESHNDYTYDNGHTNGGADIFPFIIGGQGQRRDLEDGSYTSSLIEDTQFRGLIKEVKITTNSMGEITYIPKNWGYGVWDRKVENTGEYLSALEPTEGEVTMNGEWEAKYGEGWREINVNIDTQASYNQGFADATSFNKIAMEIETDLYNKLEFLTDYSFVTTSGNNSPKSLMFDTPINYVWSYRDLSDGIAELRQNAFRSYGSIRKVKLNTIMTLGERTFKDAFELTEIDMSALIGYIATEAFDGCSKLAKIICRATGSVLLGSAPFNGLPENGVLYLTEGIDEAPWLEKLPSGWTVERL